MNLWELKQNMSTIGQQLKKVDDEISQKAINPETTTEELNQLQKTRQDLQTRFDVVKQQHDTLQKAEAARLKQPANQLGNFDGLNQEEKITKAKAEFYRAAIMPGQFTVSDEAKQLLHAIPKDNGTGGDKFLPKTLSKEVVSEPMAKNRLRDVAQLSNIKGLELPRLGFELDDDDFITDVQTAKEMKLKGDTVSFGRNKFKVKAKISDTVIHGSDVELVRYVENALRSGLAAKEKKDALTKSPKSGLEHMSFYNGDIAEVTGETKRLAIKKAIADLPEDFRENAEIVMSYADYSDMIEELNNGTTDFHNAPPERVLGKPVTFADGAVEPIIGDFNYFRINYDMTTYDTDKNVDTGEYLFVLTAWYDQKRSLDSAFRIAKVTP